MPISDHTQKLLEGVKNWNTWRFAYPHEQPRLEHVCLPDRDLRGVNLVDGRLAGADLSGANLRRANLRGADLSGADLRGAVLQGANLASACLRGARLDDAILQKANLAGADLDGASIVHAGFQLANLNRARVPGALLQEFEMLIGAEGIDNVRVGSNAAAAVSAPESADDAEPTDGVVEGDTESR